MPRSRLERATVTSVKRPEAPTRSVERTAIAALVGLERLSAAAVPFHRVVWLPSKPPRTVPHKDFSELYEKMSGKGESASGAHLG